MIITCGKCETRFELSPDKLPAGGTRVRCSRCQHRFFVRPDIPADPSRGPARSDREDSPSSGHTLSTRPDDIDLDNPQFLFDRRARDLGPPEAVGEATVPTPDVDRNGHDGLAGDVGPDGLLPASEPDLDPDPEPDTDPEPTIGVEPPEIGDAANLEAQAGSADAGSPFEAAQTPHELSPGNQAGLEAPLDTSPPTPILEDSEHELLGWGELEEPDETGDPDEKPEPLYLDRVPGQEASESSVQPTIAVSGPTLEEQGVGSPRPLFGARSLLALAVLLGFGLAAVSAWRAVSVGFARAPAPAEVWAHGWVAREVEASRIRTPLGAPALVVQGWLDPIGVQPLPEVRITLLDHLGRPLAAAVPAQIGASTADHVASPATSAPRPGTPGSARQRGRVRFAAQVTEPPARAVSFQVDLLPAS